MKTMKQENKMKKEKKDIPAINIEMIDKNNNHNVIYDVHHLKNIFSPYMYERTNLYLSAFLSQYIYYKF